MREKMTKERLRHLTSLRREIARRKSRIEELKSFCGKGARHEKDIEKARAALENYHTEAEKEAAELVSYIESIDDASVREIFMLRYYDGVRSWQRIATMAGEYDESYVRRKHDKYLNS